MKVTKVILKVKYTEILRALFETRHARHVLTHMLNFD